VRSTPGDFGRPPPGSQARPPSPPSLPRNPIRAAARARSLLDFRSQSRPGAQSRARDRLILSQGALDALPRTSCVQLTLPCVRITQNHDASFARDRSPERERESDRRGASCKNDLLGLMPSERFNLFLHNAVRYGGLLYSSGNLV